MFGPRSENRKSPREKAAEAPNAWGVEGRNAPRTVTGSSTCPAGVGSSPLSCTARFRPVKGANGQVRSLPESKCREDFGTRPGLLPRPPRPGASPTAVPPAGGRPTLKPLSTTDPRRGHRHARVARVAVEATSADVALDLGLGLRRTRRVGMDRRVFRVRGGRRMRAITGGEE